MKQLIFKELREQFKVALIAMVILTLMLFLAFNSYGSQIRQMALSILGQMSSDSLQPLMRNDLLVEISFFCGIFGTLLGWLQIRAEKHPDLWAFLVHRPIQRTAILWSKMVAGLLLYSVGAGLPLFGFIVMASIPGNVAAPFEWAMALPLATIFLIGMVYYFAGLVTGLRKARWFASRAFGLGLAVVATFGVFYNQEFWHALLIIVTVGTLMGLAAWGSFRTGGFYRDQPAAGKLALTLTSTASALLLLGLLVSAPISLLVSREGYSYSYYQLGHDGTVFRITRSGFAEGSIVDLSGQAVLDEKTGQKIRHKDLSGRLAPMLTASIDPEMRARKNSPLSEGFFRTTHFFSPWRLQDKTLWYLTADGRLVAYDIITRRFTGTLVPKGASVGGGPDDSHFVRPQNYAYNYLNAFGPPEVLASPRTAYLVDLEKRELKPLFTVTNGDAILGLSTGAVQLGPAPNSFVLILTQTAVKVLDFDGGTKLNVPFVPSPPEYPTVSVFWVQPTNSFTVRFEPDYYLNRQSGGNLLGRIEWVNSAGNISNGTDLPKLPEPTTSSVERFAVSLLPPAFPVWTWDPQYRIWNLLRIVPAIFCAAVGWWLGRRNNFSLKAQAGWGVFHLIFGLPGLLAFLAVQEWPARECCPTCKKLRAVDREKCEHCDAVFTPPGKTGTEIFEPLTVA